MKLLSFFSWFLIVPVVSYSQTFSSSPNGTINDLATSDFPLTVSGLASSIDTANFGVESVCMNLTHTYDSDLEIYLIAPDGTSASLVSHIGGADDNFTNTCLDYSAPVSVAIQAAPFTGTFKPMGELGLVNNNQNPNGTWILRIVDTYGGDMGTLISWSLNFGNNPAGYFSVTQSDLPIFIVETNGQTIPDEPKITADLKVIWNSDGSRNYISQTDFHYNGFCGVETRGASSSNMAKKSYSLELRDVNGFDIDSALCGFPAESDWVLSAQYADKSLIRNMFSMHLIQEMGWYAPRCRPVELILDGEYKGVYILLEKVKRGNDRIDIPKLLPTEIAGDDLTGGYILKLDKNSGNSYPGFNSQYLPWPGGDSIEISYYYPEGDVIVPQQRDYITAYVDSFETALVGPDFEDSLLGYRNFVNLESCVDAFIISELSRSIDAYRKSFFIYKDKTSNGGKLVMAPIWDYDLTFGNVDFCEGFQTDGWQYNFNYVCSGDYWLNPFWWERMAQDDGFNQAVRCRWRQLRLTSLHKDSLDGWIDQMAQTLNESQSWNYTVWPTMGTYVWPNYFVGSTYTSEIDYLKTWLHDRIDWLDINLPGDETICSYAGLNEQESGNLSLYPNPMDEQDAHVSLLLYQAQEIELTVTDALGKTVLRKTIPGTPGTNIIDWNTSGLQSGMYAINLVAGNRSWHTKGIKR